MSDLRVNPVATDRGHIGLHSDQRDRKVNGQFLSCSGLQESSYSSIFREFQSYCFRAIKVIWCFFRFYLEPVEKVRATPFNLVLV